MDTPTTEIIATEIAATESVTDDVDEVAEQLAQHERITAEQHAEILGRVDVCRDLLQQFSTRLDQTQAESPILSQLLTVVTAIQSEMMQVKSDLQSLKDSTPMIPPTASESTPEVVTVIAPEAPEEPNPEGSTVEPVQAAPEAPRPRKKFRLL